MNVLTLGTKHMTGRTCACNPITGALEVSSTQWWVLGTVAGTLVLGAAFFRSKERGKVRMVPHRGDIEDPDIPAGAVPLAASESLPVTPEVEKLAAAYKLDRIPTRAQVEKALARAEHALSKEERRQVEAAIEGQSQRGMALRDTGTLIVPRVSAESTWDPKAVVMRVKGGPLARSQGEMARAEVLQRSMSVVIPEGKELSTGVDTIVFRGDAASQYRMREAYDLAMLLRQMLIAESNRKAHTLNVIERETKKGETKTIVKQGPCDATPELQEIRERVRLARKIARETGDDTELQIAQAQALEADWKHQAPLRAALERYYRKTGKIVRFDDERATREFFKTCEDDLCEQCHSTGVLATTLNAPSAMWKKWIAAMQARSNATASYQEAVKHEKLGHGQGGSEYVAHRDEMDVLTHGRGVPQFSSAAKNRPYRTIRSDSFGAGQAWQRGEQKPRRY